ncbi:DUF4917 family protein [Halarcobacter bivalviorum]|uniref:DUF4917 family protein n=1 Tax=Halarcobacter bivalviorum TaxID=663364 RepID=UPI00100A292D|nr:DUF4917 family protein [Halarcobacter bivalviorum]RXK05383.1 hypothetical protein CRU97_08555 [Halarcobacter bivalviorum]
MEKELLSYQEVLNRTEDGYRYLLLGNGFSIDYNPDKFLFKNLFEYAKNKSIIKSHSSISKHFEELEVYDFEEVIKYLENALMVLKNYTQENEHQLIMQIKEDIDSLKEFLIKTIVEIHPENPFNIQEYEYQNCINFLKEYNAIFTLNYDLLLTWVTLEYLNNYKYLNYSRLSIDDGFRGYLNLCFKNNNFYLYPQRNTQTIYYLHGALHLFNQGVDIVKNSNLDATLIESTTHSIKNSNYPLFVSEGNSKKKMEKILNNHYLTNSLKCLHRPPFRDNRIRKTLNYQLKSLIVYGTLLDKDDHIINAILKGSYQNIYVGVRSRAKLYEPACLNLSSKFKKANKNIDFYDFNTANVWRT